MDTNLLKSDFDRYPRRWDYGVPDRIICVVVWGVDGENYLAIVGKKKLEILYLKAKDEKSRRVIIPTFMGELEYQGRTFPGLQAFCSDRMAERIFHMERILRMRKVEEDG